MKKKKSYIDISILGYEDKEKYPIYVSENTFKRHVDLLLIGEEGKGNYVLVKDFHTFMYGHALLCRRKTFCHYCLQAFSTAGTFKSHINNYFETNGKKIIKVPRFLKR